MTQDRRDGILMKQSDDLDEDGSFLQSSLLDFYQIRPFKNDCHKEDWNDTCLGDFVPNQDIVTKPKNGSNGFDQIIKLHNEWSLISKRKRSV